MLPRKRVSSYLAFSSLLVLRLSGIFSVTLSLNCPILFEQTWPAVSWYHSLVESGLSSDFQPRIYCGVKPAITRLPYKIATVSCAAFKDNLPCHPREGVDSVLTSNKLRSFNFLDSRLRGNDN